MSVGTYSSPHVSRVNERITFDGSPIEDEELSEAVGRVARAAQRTGVTPSWFEALTAAGLWFLAIRDTEVAVIEVGMLGRWDATNVVDGTVAVVTNVQLDHTDVAGPTRAAIAAEKAGIIKPGATLVLGEADPDLRPIFEAEDPGLILTEGREMTWRNRRAVPGGSIVDLVNPWAARNDVFVGMTGAFQCDNALLALTAAEAFVGSAIPDAVVDAALGAARLPGHFEIVHSDPTVVLDGAHNPAAAVALRRALDEAFAGVTPRVLLCGALAGRDPVEFLDKLGASAADLLVATEPTSPRALPAEALSEAARSLGIPTVTVADPERALDAAVAAAGTSGLVVATGSLYLISALRTAAAWAS
jgi:dihydrofolate synthase/folylpolyglutamate synthase